MDLITYLASDTHREGTIYKIMPQIIKKLKKEISEEKLYEVTTKNPAKIIENLINPLILGDFVLLK